MMEIDIVVNKSIHQKRVFGGTGEEFDGSEADVVVGAVVDKIVHLRFFVELFVELSARRTMMMRGRWINGVTVITQEDDGVCRRTSYNSRIDQHHGGSHTARLTEGPFSRYRKRESKRFSERLSVIERIDYFSR